VDSDAFAKLRHLVRDVKVGGIHVFGATEPMPALLLNSTYGAGGGASRKGDPYVAAALLNRLQSEAEVPLLTTADFEGGVGYMMNGATRRPRRRDDRDGEAFPRTRRHRHRHASWPRRHRASALASRNDRAAAIPGGNRRGRRCGHVVAHRAARARSGGCARGGAEAADAG